MNTSKREWIKIPANRNNNPYSLFECPVCGYLMAWHERNCASHKRNHNHVLDICDTCGVWLNYMQREKLKRDAYKMADKAIRIEEKKFAYLLEWYSRYMRSLDSYSDIDKHPCFEDYISMILHQTTFDKNDIQISHHGRDVIESLVKDFGTLKGIPYGSFFLDDYSGVNKVLMKDYFDSVERPRANIPEEYKEIAVKQWVLCWKKQNNQD